VGTLFNLGKAGLAIPEPVTVLLLMAGGLLGLIRRR